MTLEISREYVEAILSQSRMRQGLRHSLCSARRKAAASPSPMRSNTPSAFPSWSLTASHCRQKDQAARAAPNTTVKTRRGPEARQPATRAEPA